MEANTVNDNDVVIQSGLDDDKLRDLIGSIVEGTEPPDGSFSVADAMKMYGKNRKNMRRILNALVEEGELEKGKFGNANYYWATE